MTTKIVVIGMGYVGIPCGALLAEVDEFEVVGLQRRSKRSGWKIEALNSGKSPLEGDEPGLEELIAKVVADGKFRATDDVSVLADADIILIDVQTPTDMLRAPKYDSLREVSESVGNHLKKGALVIVESTVAPGTTENMVKKTIENVSGLKCGEGFDLAFSYERVMPGKLIRNIVHLPRVVGGTTERSAKRAKEMYSKIVKEKIYTTSRTLTAELAKTVENAYRDVNIAFANEMALVCESLGENIFEIIDLINVLPNRNIHIPGAGVGGHCLPKDSWLLRYGVYEYGSWKVEPEFITLARRINDHMPIHMSYLVEDALRSQGVSIENSRVAILGVAYLENSDDARNTPAAPLAATLQSRGAEVALHDPHVKEWDFGPLNIERDILDAARDADCLALVTKHKEYYSMNLNEVKAVMRIPAIVDGRNVFQTDEVRSMGFEYRAIGKAGIHRH